MTRKHVGAIYEHVFKYQMCICCEWILELPNWGASCFLTKDTWFSFRRFLSLILSEICVQNFLLTDWNLYIYRKLNWDSKSLFNSGSPLLNISLVITVSGDPPPGGGIFRTSPPISETHPTIFLRLAEARKFEHTKTNQPLFLLMQAKCLRGVL